jgi:hypothetical protein
MKATKSSSPGRPGLWFLVLVTVILAVLFWESFVPGQVLFSNDGPLSIQKANWIQLPQGFTGFWGDLNNLGGTGGSFPPDINAVIRMVLGAVGYAKFMAPITLMIAGICAWFFFRRLGFTIAACGLAGLAVALNSDFFSTACWGVGPQVIAFGMNFLAMGLVVANGPNTGRVLRWTRIALAGLAVGMGVMEAADIGAIFSLLTAGFVVFYSTVEGKTGWGGLARGVGRTALIAVFAGFIAASTVSSLVTTQIQGIAGTGQDAETKAEHWGWATQWSMPRNETLGLVVPGLFGYRTYGATQETLYWGGVGRDPGADSFLDKGQPPPPGALLHFIGSGIYAGIPVVLVALWAALQAFRRKDSLFDIKQRKLIWFWSGVAVLSLLLSFGRFAPFYQFFYALPYASAIRNPVKFLHVLSFALLVIFGYGVDGLCRRYLGAAIPSFAAATGRSGSWWARVGAFDKRWVIGCALVLGVSLVGWGIYASSRGSLQQYLETFAGIDGDSARVMAAFSIRQVGWAVLFLAVSVGLLAWLLSGGFSGSRSKMGGVLLGVVLVADLGRANLPWLHYWDVEEKYASNPIIDLLRSKPYEHRVALLPWTPPQFTTFYQLYGREWREQHFVYYNIQTLDTVQQPRLQADLAAFESALRVDTNAIYRLARRWQLTNTRYLLGPAGFLEALNQQLDPVQQRFRIAAAFDLAPKPGVTQVTRLEQLTAVLKPDGPYALFEFSGALPRAKLYTRWQVNTNDQQALDTIASAAFDPTQTVVVGNPLPAADAANAPKQTSATVEYASYAPKRIVFHSKAEAPTVLLLNDRFDPGWKVSVDGRPEKLLHCNYIMRGVYLPAGAHVVEFRFQAPTGLLYVTVAGIGVSLLLLGVLALAGRDDGIAPAPAKEAQAQPAAPRAR